MSSAGDAAMTPSTQTGLSYTSGPGRWVLLVTVLGSAVASMFWLRDSSARRATTASTSRRIALLLGRMRNQ